MAKIHTLHQNFLQTIQEFNSFYNQYITAEYDQGIDHYYKPSTRQLKPKYAFLNDANADLTRFAEILVKVTGEIAADIKSQHLD